MLSARRSKLCWTRSPLRKWKRSNVSQSGSQLSIGSFFGPPINVYPSSKPWRRARVSVGQKNVKVPSRNSSNTWVDPLSSQSRKTKLLLLYQVISKSMISSILIREEDRVQLPIYYIKRLPLDAETCYLDMEKLAFVLVTVARKLRPYFQDHTIVVTTKYPLKQVLQRAKASEQISQWIVELGEFEIHYRPRPTIKGQVITEFTMIRSPQDNCSPRSPSESWMSTGQLLSVDLSWESYSSTRMKSSWATHYASILGHPTTKMSMML